MSRIRKLRVDAILYEFHLYNCAKYLIEVDGKIYAYEAVILKLAKQISGYTQPVYSLYRDLNRTEHSREIYGMRAICISDYNSEGNGCKVFMYKEAGKNMLSMEDSIK